MSGEKKLKKVCRNIRVVAIPGRKKEVANGYKNGDVAADKVQLYNIYKMY